MSIEISSQIKLEGSAESYHKMQWSVNEANQAVLHKEKHQLSKIFYFYLYKVLKESFGWPDSQHHHGFYCDSIFSKIKIYLW